MSRCEEHDVNEWACVTHPRTGMLTHFKRPWPGCRLDFTGSSLHGAHDPLETDGGPDLCSDGSGRLYPFPRQHPHCGGVCVRCGQTVAEGHGQGRCSSVPEELRTPTP